MLSFGDVVKQREALGICNISGLFHIISCCWQKVSARCAVSLWVHTGPGSIRAQSRAEEWLRRKKVAK